MTYCIFTNCLSFSCKLHDHLLCMCCRQEWPWRSELQVKSWLGVLYKPLCPHTHPFLLLTESPQWLCPHRYTHKKNREYSSLNTKDTQISQCSSCLCSSQMMPAARRVLLYVRRERNLNSYPIKACVVSWWLWNYPNFWVSLDHIVSFRGRQKM